MRNAELSKTATCTVLHQLLLTSKQTAHNLHLQGSGFLSLLQAEVQPTSGPQC